MNARVVEVSVPFDDYTCLRAFQVEYQHMSGEWLIHSIYQDEKVANYIKEQLEKHRISVPLF